MKVLLTEEQIREGVERMASTIREFYIDRRLTIIGILTGSIVLLADLIRCLDMPLRVGLVQARSYRNNSTKPGPLVINTDFLPDIKDRDVLLVDDIYDTGHTMFELISQIDDLGPKSLRTAVLLRKEGRQEVAYEPNYVVFDIPNDFVIGYGLDYRDNYRNLPYVAILDENELAEEPSD